MKSKVSRIFIVDGIEYRIKKTKMLATCQHVQDKLVSLGLVHVEKKSTRKTGRRKKYWQLKLRGYMRGCRGLLITGLNQMVACRKSR